MNENNVAESTKALIANLAVKLRFNPIHINACTESDIVDLDWSSVQCLVHLKLYKEEEWYEKETGHIIDTCSLIDLKNHKYQDRIKHILVELKDVSKWLCPSIFQAVAETYQLPIDYKYTDRLQKRLIEMEETY